MKLPTQVQPVKRQVSTANYTPKVGVTASSSCGCPNTCIGLCIGGTCNGICV